MSGSMSREWKRTVWQAPQARRTAPRHFLTLPILTAESWKGLDYRRSVYRRTFADLQTPRRMMDCFNCFTYDQA
jgi:hypothetical protein